MVDERHRRAAELLVQGYTQVEAAEAVGVSPRTIRRWRNAGKLDGLAAEAEPDNEPDKVAPEGHPGGNGTGSGASLSEARRRKALALALKRELEAGRMVGDLVPISMLRHVTTRIRRAVETAPRRHLQEIAELMNVAPREAMPVVERITDTLLDAAREAVAELPETPPEREAPPWAS